jgi:hypothetical protein
MFVLLLTNTGIFFLFSSQILFTKFLLGGIVFQHHYFRACHPRRRRRRRHHCRQMKVFDADDVFYVDVLDSVDDE